MESHHNRRNFIKKVGVYTLLSQVPLPVWAEGFSTLLGEGVKPAGEFSLLKLEKILPAYNFPFITKFSCSSFKLDYALYNMYGNNVTEAGDFILNAELKGENLQCIFTSARLANNGITDRSRVYKYFVSGSIFCTNNIALSPQKWNVSSKISLSDDGEAFGDTGIQNIGVVKGEEIHYKIGDKEFRKSVGTGTLSWKWGLIAVAQKMAEASIRELQFAILDEFDAIYAKQIMKYRRKVTLDCGKERLIDFKVFELTGDGMIPTVYWIDDMNRTVFVISGMEAYILKM
jgi:hypothetical protein